MDILIQFVSSNEYTYRSLIRGLSTPCKVKTDFIFRQGILLAFIKFIIKTQYTNLQYFIPGLKFSRYATVMTLQKYQLRCNMRTTEQNWGKHSLWLVLVTSSFDLHREYN